jgi:hypothetical protein
MFRTQSLHYSYHSLGDLTPRYRVQHKEDSSAMQASLSITRSDTAGDLALGNSANLSRINSELVILEHVQKTIDIHGRNVLIYMFQLSFSKMYLFLSSASAPDRSPDNIWFGS